MNGVVVTIAGAWHSLLGVSAAALLAGVALHVVKLGAEARSWHWIVDHAFDGSQVRFRATLGAFVSAIGANAVLPARVGEALRVGMVRRHVPGASVVTVAATIVLEAMFEAAFGAFVIAVVVVGGAKLPGGGSSGLSTLLASPIALGVMGAVLGAAIATLVIARAPARRLLARFAVGFSIMRSPRLVVTRVLAWKVVAWTARLASVVAFLMAFHVHAAAWTGLVVIAAQNVAALMPLLPGNAGTQQAVIGTALAGTASAASLLGFGVGMQAATTVADLLLGATALWWLAAPGDLARALATLKRRPRLGIGAGLRRGRPGAASQT